MLESSGLYTNPVESVWSEAGLGDRRDLAAFALSTFGGAGNPRVDVLFVGQLAEIELLRGDEVITDALVRAGGRGERSSTPARKESAVLLVVLLPLLIALARLLAAHFDALLMIQVSNLRTGGLLVHRIVEFVAALFVELLGAVGPSNLHLARHQANIAAEAPAD